jgi:hypothetical protein
MIIKTDLFKKGISILSNIKTNKIFPGLTTFYTENNKLYGEVIASNSIVVKTLLAEDVSETIDFNIIIYKLDSIIKSCDKDTIEITVRPSNLVVKATVEATISLHEATASMPKYHGFSSEILKEVDLPFLDYRDLLSDYLATAHINDINYSNVYIKDRIIVTNVNSFRVSKTGFDLPYPIILNKSLFLAIINVLEEKQDALHIRFYDKGFEIINNNTIIMSSRVESIENIFNANILKIQYNQPSLPVFSINKRLIDDICKNMSYLLKDRNGVVALDLLNNKIVLDSIEDNVQVPCNFKADPSFVSKKLNLLRLQKLCKNCKDDFTISSSFEANSLLYFENDLEYLVMAAVKK